eukprot:TRINITY_DN2187_c0_g1_i4.p2 TRINITY_DN2187_c0_g1~~TRINITY_DN2187_c0_g1_i4.p2  ORF type:complete len:100 (+),score=20.11 TRINITY_DN2187_c0_g1_i4:67-366(+)
MEGFEFNPGMIVVGGYAAAHMAHGLHDFFDFPGSLIQGLFGPKTYRGVVEMSRPYVDANLAAIRAGNPAKEKTNWRQSAKSPKRGAQQAKEDVVLDIAN